jgi:hypothetical protein
MKLGRTFPICILVAVASPAAFAQSVWTCTFQGYGNDNKPVIKRFRVVGADVVVDDQFQQHYQIVQNNAYGLVAEWSISAIEPDNHSPSVGEFLIVINKQTNEFKAVTVTMGEQNYAPRVGTCIPN